MKTNTEINDKLHTICQNYATLITTIRYWVNEFERGQTSVFDEEHPDRPVDVTADDMINKVHHFILSNCRMKIKEIAKMINILIKQNTLLKKLE